MKRLDGLCEINALSVYIFNLLVSWFLGRFEEPRSPNPYQIGTQTAEQMVTALVKTRQM
jgi:hypothetical protein